ncbi:MAG: hypothetical protein CVU48_05325 [Candidatus Cloacimonetes bacterium HGW-Cloacimonetes-1]|jgi:hypothetical protein|nr:MAG: hypothetical protein CVU48_05325 [Candidatus Cloacimonetes bacterium HGW-Cloacimonetes-1]
MRSQITLALFILVVASSLFAAGPANISNGLQMWLDADALGWADGTSVSNWPDQSGNNKNAVQDTTNFKPTYRTNIVNGKPAIVFDGTDYLAFDGNIAVNTNYTIIAVVKRTANSPGSFHYFLGGIINSQNKNLQLGWRGNTTFTHGQYTNDYDMSVDAYSAGQIPRIFTTRHSTTMGKNLFLNGSCHGVNMNSAVSGRLANLTAWVGAGIGRYMSGTINTRFNGWMAELIFYNRYLTETERKSIETYLSAKYNIPVANAPDPSYYTNMFEIEVKSGTTTNTFTSGGLTLNSEYLIATSRIRGGHNNATGVTNTFNPDGALYPNFLRANREWFFETTSGNQKTTFSYDLNALGLTGVTPNVNNYRLLFRLNNSSAYTILGGAPTVAGNVISFVLNPLIPTINSGFYTVGVLDGSSITLASANPAVTAGSVSPGTIKHPLYRFTLTTAGSATTLDQVNFTTSGTYTAADLTNLKLWYSTSDNISAASQIGSLTSSLGPVSHTFSGLTQNLSGSTVGYFWITADLASAATPNNTINVAALTTANLTFSNGLKAGTAYAGGSQTIVYTSHASDYFRTIASGNWNAPGVWQSSPDGISWYAATAYPTATSNTVFINAGHVITLTQLEQCNDIVMDGGTINQSSNVLTIEGVLTQNSGTISGGTPTIDGYHSPTLNFLHIGETGNNIAAWSITMNQPSLMPTHPNRSWTINGTYTGTKSATFYWTDADDNGFDWTGYTPAIWKGLSKYSPTSYDITGATRFITVDIPSSLSKGDYVIGFEPDLTLPIELSHFSATPTSEYYIRINWVTQSETSVMGYYVYRNNVSELGSAIKVSPMIYAANSSNETSYAYLDREITSGTWYYWLQNVNIGGDSDFNGPVMATLNGDNDNPNIPTVPLTTGIQRVFPNPFNPTSTISYSIAKANSIKLDIINIRGQLVRTLVSDFQNQGYYRELWNGDDSNGIPCSSGIYYVRLRSGNDVTSHKIVLMK